MTPIPSVNQKNNKRVLAARLRAHATRLDRTAWSLEQHAHSTGATYLMKFVKQNRLTANQLRRHADELAPKRTGGPKRTSSLILPPSSL